MSGASSLSEIALLFLRLGVTGFGGPAAHIAMMQDEVVRRRRWLSDERFLDLVGATNLIPGPSSTELAIHIGRERAGWAGLIVAGASFILPAMLITAMLGHAYVRFGALPAADGLLYGVKPVIVAIVAQALWSLAPKAASNAPLCALGVAAAAACALGVHELAVLLGSGAAAMVVREVDARARGALALLPPLLPATATVAATSTAASVTLPGLFWVFCKTGSVLFGSGYVLIAFLRADLVERLHWLSEAQLIDAIAVGQVTPGPVFTTATFIGYVLAGPAGALTATGGIFLPAFVFVALSAPLLPRLRASRAAGAFLDGVNVASLALMAVVTAQIAGAAIVDVPTVLLAVAAAGLLLLRLNSTWLVLGGALTGLALHAS
jgi:chromate transporter